MTHVSGKSRRRIEKSQRMKKRFFKGGHMVINELRTIDPETWERLRSVTDYFSRPPTAGDKHE